MLEKWIIAGSSVVTLAGAVMAHGLFSARSCLFGPVISRGSPLLPARVALTFDDGPHPQATDAICRILARHQVPAAFFFIGANVERWPDAVRRVAEAGHLIGNHSFDHSNYGLFRGQVYWSDQLKRTNDAIQVLIGKPVTHFRPPMGFKHPPLLTAARAAGQDVVTWSLRAFDGVRSTSRRIQQRLGPRATAGDILLLHDGAPPGRLRDPQATVDAIEPLIHTLRSRSLEIVRLDELLKSPAESASSE